MDEFKKLNWLWNSNRSTTSSLYDRRFSDDEKDVFFCHLNEIDQIHLLDSYGRNGLHTTENITVRKDPRNGKIVTNESIDHSTFPKITLYSNFPQRSSMDGIQHQACLNAVAKLRTDASNTSISDRNDIRVYAQLSLERSKEKTIFSDFVKGEFFNRNIKNCYNLRPELNKFITKRLDQSVQSILASDDNYYQLQSAIPISRSDSSGEITIEHEKTISESGVVLTVNSNKYKNPVQLSSSFLEHFFENAVDITVPVDESFLHSHSVDVVISLKTLSSILTSAKILSTDWNVKFTLKPCDDKNVIIFDEILPAVSLGCLEKNRMAYKYSVKAGVAVPKKKEVFSFATKQLVKRTLPTIGNCSTQPNPLQEAVSDYKVWVFEEYLTKFSSKDSTNRDLTTTDSNHIRRLWNVKRNNVDYCRLVIDNSQDYCEKQKDGTVKHINLSPKLEYQCEFGAEQMTLSELIADWCELRFGPNTITHRVRIDARSGCVQDVKEVSIKDVEYDLQRLYRVNAETLLEPFFNFIDIIRKFPPNEYLLSHLEKHKTQAMVYVKTNAGSSTNAIQVADIYRTYGADTSNLEALPWNPIDDAICTAIHTTVMPCAFPHSVKKGKKVKRRSAQSNDRALLVEKAVRKNQEKEDRKLQVIRRTKSLKKKKSKLKKQKLKKLLANRPKLNFDGEALDPYTLFDEQGNIHIGDLVNRQQKEEKDVAEPIGGTTSLDEPMSFETYCRDAAGMSDDSIDS